MDSHRLFTKFDEKIRLVKSKRDWLACSRKALRDKIKKRFKEEKWPVPKFYSQGSFALATNVNPIPVEEDGETKDKYDLDDGVYFICSKEDRLTEKTYHNRILKAVEGHACEEVDKSTCVRVIYTDGHHIDLPCYWKADEESVPQLADTSKGYLDSDPKEFAQWVRDEIKSWKKKGQLRRCIRYLKAWADYRQNCNQSLKMISGFILTILCCNHYHEEERDDVALYDTVEGIRDKLKSSFKCYRPTTPTDEDLLEKYSEEKVMNELENFLRHAKNALNAKTEKEAADHWRKLFGDRFPKGEEKKSEENNNKDAYQRTEVHRPWFRS